jgi:hypothetical protein
MTASRITTPIMLGAALHVAFLRAPSLALADPPEQSAVAGADVIYLRSGQVVRGTLVELIPNGQARMKLANGEVATIVRPEIMRVEREGEPSDGAGVAGLTATSPARAWIRLEGTSHERLEWDTTGHQDWTTACFAPCERRLPVSVMYRVAGDEMKSSPDFRLSVATMEPDVITVHGASTKWYGVGVVALGTGTLIASLGVDVALLQSVAFRGEANSPGATRDSWAAMGIGAAIAVVGLALMLLNLRTVVSYGRGSGQATPPPGDSSKLWPTWKDSRSVPPGVPPVMGLPIFDEKF